MLRETQRAVGGEEMVKHWERLCNLRKEAREVETVPPILPLFHINSPLPRCCWDTY